MISTDHYITANVEQVAAKVIDDEAILINLASGMYYSMVETASFVWSMIERGSTVEAIVGSLSEHYDVAPEQAECDVLALSNELATEGLVTISENGAVTEPAPSSPSTPKNAYGTPKLEKFTDMAEMFALDPPLPGLAESDGS